MGESPLFSLCRFGNEKGTAAQTQIAENMALDLDRVRQIAERVAGSSGLEVVELEVCGAGKHRMLRVFIDRLFNERPFNDKPGEVPADRPDGVTHEDCSKFSREFGTILDVEDAMPGGSYMLEVSSPGLDRKLTKAADFERFRGSRVKLTTREPVNNNRHFEGTAGKFRGRTADARFERGEPQVAQEDGRGAGEEIEIEFANVEKANLVPEI